MFEHGVGRIGDALAALVAALDPDAFSIQTASAVWAGLDRVERLAAAGKTVLARRAAQRAEGPDGSSRAGQSGVEDMARRAGTSVGAVRDSVTTSQRLVDLPILDSALRAGGLSTAQAQQIASAATADPSAQERLVAMAPKVSLPELRDECARVRAAADPDPEARNARLRAGRRLRRYTDPEGAWNLSARGTPQAGALFNSALDSIIDECFAAARAAGRREAYEAHAFDALMVMARRATDPEGATPPATPHQTPAGGTGVHRQPGQSAHERPPGHDNLFGGAMHDDAPFSNDGESEGESDDDAAPDDEPGVDRMIAPETSSYTVPEGGGGFEFEPEHVPAGDSAIDDGPSGRRVAGTGVSLGAEPGGGASGRRVAGTGAMGDRVPESLRDHDSAAEDPPQELRAEPRRAEPGAGGRSAGGLPITAPANDEPGGSEGTGREPDGSVRVAQQVGVDRPTDHEQRGDESMPPAGASDHLRAPTGPRLGGSSESVVPALSRPRRAQPRHLALLRVDLAALQRGAVDGDELCEIAGVGPVPVSVARELLGDAVLKLVITRGVDVLNVTHLGRGPTAAQRVALAWTSPGCSVEGCWRTRVEIDHREAWARTRHTRLDELDHLCAFHHDLKTRLGWALVPGTGKRAFVPPDDPRHPRHRGKAGRADDNADESAPPRGPSVVDGAASGGGAAPGLTDPGTGSNEGDRPPPPRGRAA